MVISILRVETVVIPRQVTEACHPTETSLANPSTR
jgi:hypothetical protein